MNLDDAFRNLLSHYTTSLPTTAVAPVRKRGGSKTTIHTHEMEEIEPITAEELAAEGEDTVDEALPKTRVSAALPLDLSVAHVLPDFDCSVMEEGTAVAEQYRFLASRIRAAELARPSLMLTACRNGEGVTSTALNLSLALAQNREQKTLLLDLNFRWPAILELTQTPVEPDLKDVLRGDCRIEEAMRYSETDGLYVLGPGEPAGNGTAALLESAHLREMMERLHATFDLVIIDTPPCLSLADPMIVGKLAGGAALVARARRTQRESIAAAALALKEQSIPVLGMVLNFMKSIGPRCFDPFEYGEDLGDPTHEED